MKQPIIFKRKTKIFNGCWHSFRYIRAVNEGIDMFDCVMPTRSGRTGLAFTWQGKVNLKIQNIKTIRHL